MSSAPARCITGNSGLGNGQEAGTDPFPARTGLLQAGALHHEAIPSSPVIAKNPIGTIHSPFTTLEDMPIQPRGAPAVSGTIVLREEFAPGLRDLEGFSHIFLIYLFHEAKRTELSVVAFMDTVARGVFATRSPLRPNHIGLSVVELLSVDGPGLHVRGVDILDNTPRLDIKPFISAFDQVTGSRDGWMTATAEEVAVRRSDSRFA